MDFDIFDWNSIILGGLSALLAAECVVLFVKSLSMKNKMESEIEKAKKDFQISSEKKELELKREYDELSVELKQKKSDLDERLSECRVSIESAKQSAKQSLDEYQRFKKFKDHYTEKANEYANKILELNGLDKKTFDDEAKERIIKICMKNLESYKSEMLQRTKKEIDNSALGILVNAISRAAVSYNQGMNTSVVKLPNEAMKGRIIGKEGRNIKSFELATETTVYIDENPDSIMISSFDPVKREIAKLTLEKLIASGKINPATIESTLLETKEEMEKDTYEFGYQAIEKLQIGIVPNELINALGKLKFHFSLNQNSLEHSIETARIAGLLAAELCCDPQTAKRSALFHDIGKLSESNMSHARAAAEMLRRAGEKDVVVNAVESHHSEVKGESIYAAIVQIADSISASRIGARMSPIAGYIERVKMLEDIALSFEGVLSAYVIQAGRELRVIVSPEDVSDIAAAELVQKIKDAISLKADNSVPIKITLIREKRFVENT